MDIDYINHMLVIGLFLFMVYHISLRYQPEPPSYFYIPYNT